MTIDMHIFLGEVAKDIRRFLAPLLPEIGGEEWWQRVVYTQLSYSQQQAVKRDQIEDLDGLDLAALLRVFTRNWSEIRDRANLDPKAVTWAHEIRGIRNRVAHKGAEPELPEDRYRDLDTLERFCRAIGADRDLLEKLKDQKERSISEIAGSPSGTVEEPPADPPAERVGVSEQAEEDAGSMNHEAPERGFDIELLGKGATRHGRVEELLRDKTYVGIDFGTSTTVVSYLTIDEEAGFLVAESMPIPQTDEFGRQIESRLVPSCIAWTGGILLVGEGARALKGTLQPGRNFWSSFKMKLGIDLGPEYFNSELSGPDAPVRITNAQDAARVFFRFLKDAIDSFLSSKGMPRDVVCSVSVPASFEANQRQDLCRAIQSAGINLPEHGILDEPNAAFISYLSDRLRAGSGVIRGIEERPRKVMVFDFGAGTCDISILEVGFEGGRFKSRNLSLSQFFALGGDNIDRQIVREVLLEQLLEQNDFSGEFTSREMEVAVIPRLQRAAEAIKIQCCKYIAENWGRGDISVVRQSEQAITGKDVDEFRVRGEALRIARPSITLSQFAQVMDPFLDPNARVHAEEDLISIFEPVKNALDKAGLKGDDLDMVLFIGGSSQNPFIQKAIADHFGRFVNCEVPSDLRTPVSRGAALSSFLVNGIGCEIIKPITSEPVLVITRGGALREVLPAGTEIPSGEVQVDDLLVSGDEQRKVEIPVCVTNEDKVLGVLEVRAPDESPFSKGGVVKIRCRVNENKLLEVHARVGEQVVESRLMNPLSNCALTVEETRMLTARQKMHESALEGNGRPSVASVIHYAGMCGEAGHHLEAAEAYRNVERLDRDRDYATSICYHYSHAGRRALADRWAEKAYNRRKTPTSAFNLALAKKRNGDDETFERHMEEALTLDRKHKHAPTMEYFGRYLREKGDPRGLTLIEAAFEIFNRKFEEWNLDADDCRRFRRAAEQLGRGDAVEKIDRRLRNRRDPGLYSDENLAASEANGGERMSK